MRSDGVFAAVRLLRGDQLIASLRRHRKESGTEAMAVVTCAGSLRSAHIRHADADSGTLYEKPFEIVSLAGTMNPNHQHLHLSIADREGKVFGGHLLPGSAVYTTAEIVTLILTDFSFGRAPCDCSGFDELIITKRKAEA